MCGRVMATKPIPPPPTKKDGKCGAAVRTVGTEVGQNRENGLIGGMEKRNEIFLRTCHRALTVRTYH